MSPFTLIALGILSTLALIALGIAFWISQPTQRRRKYRDGDEHAQWRFI
jgi:hypothetical protein